MASMTGPLKPNPSFLFHPCRTLNVTTSGASVDPDAVNCVTASSRFGLIFVGYEKGVKIYQLEDIQNCDVESDSRGPFENCPNKMVATTNSVILVSLSADELTLAVVVVRDSVPVADMYDVRGFAHQVPETRPFFSIRLSSQPTVGLQDFAWNPVQCNMFAVCLTDGSATNYELCGEAFKMHGSIPASTGAKALAWSPKGKQVVVGKQDGSLVQFKPTMQEAKTLAPPTIFENPVQVMSVCWIAPTVFAAVYLPSGNVADPQPVLVITAFTKVSPVSYTAFDELCLKTGTHPRERFWLYHQPDWGILLFASRNSNETAVLGCTSVDKMKWEQWELDSDGRAEVPLHKGEDTFPLGFSLIYCSQRNIVGKLQTWPPMPMLFLFSTCGTLCPFHMKNLAPGVPSLVRPPEPLGTDGQRKPMAAITSAATTGPMQPSFGTLRPIAPLSSQPFLPPTSTSCAPSAFTFGSSGGSSFSFGSTTSLSTTTQAAPTSAPPISFSFSNTASKTTSMFGVPSVSTAANNTTGGGGPLFSTNSSNKSLSVVVAPEPIAVSSAPTLPAGSPFRFGTTATVPTSTAVSSASAFSFVPKQNVLYPSPSQAVPLRTAVTVSTEIAKPAESYQDVKKLAGEPSKPSEMPSEPASRSISDNAIVSAIMEEIQAFQKELKEFKKGSSKGITPSATQVDMNRILENSTTMEETGEKLKKELSGLNSNVHMLNSLILEAFAEIEEGRTQELRNRDPRFLGLLHSRKLDPMTAQRLLEIRQLHQYLESQLRDVHARLDLEWHEYMMKRNEKCRQSLPSVQAMYEVIRHCRNTSQSLAVQVDTVSQRIKEMKAEKKFGTQAAHWDKKTGNTGIQSSVDELSALADSLLWTSLSRKRSSGKNGARSKAISKVSPMSLVKQTQLAEYFGQQSATPVRARPIGNPSESRLLSKLSLLLSEPSHAAEQKHLPVSSPKGAIEAQPKNTVHISPQKIMQEDEGKTPCDSFSIPPFASTPVKAFASPIGSICSGVAHVKTTVAPTRVPVAKVIQVSLPATDKPSAPVIPPGLTITPIMPPEVFTTVVTTMITKPTFTEATKPFGTPPPFGSSAAPVFNFGTATTSKFVNEPTVTTKPGFVAVKPAAPTAAFAEVETKPESEQEKSTKSGPYEDITPTGSPQPVQKSTSGSNLATQHPVKNDKTPTCGAAMTPEAHTSGKAGIPMITTATAASVATTATTVVTAALFSLPVTTTSSSSTLFKLNFGQPGAVKKTSIFGNTSQASSQSVTQQETPKASVFGNMLQPPYRNTSVASSAAAFSFTAALAATKEPVPTVDSKQAPSAAVTVAKPMPVSPPAASTTAVVLPPVSFSAVTTVADSALFHPVSIFATPAVVQPSSSATAAPVKAEPASLSKDNVADDSCKPISTAPTPAENASFVTSTAASINHSRTATSTDTSVSQTSVSHTPSTVVPADQKELQLTSSLETKLLNQEPTTTVMSPFTQGPVQASPFGQATALFGKPQATVPAFGESPPVFGKTTLASSQLPSQASGAATLPTFSQATTTASPFWKPSPTFLQQQSTSTSLFGQPAVTSGTSIFGQPSSSTSAFGQSNVFGSSQQHPSTEASPFSSTSTGTSGSLFGQKTTFGFQQTSPPFGQSESLFGQKTSFGQSSAPAFGQPQGTCAFGEQSQEQSTQQGSLFGGFLSCLGGKPSGEGAPKNVFGGSSTFGSGTQSTGLFGSQGALSFGSSFGPASGGAFSGGGGSVAQSGFGAFQQTPTKPATFGGPPAFGGSPSFGGPPQFGGSPTFGSSPGVLGSSPSFGSSQPPPQQHPGSPFSVFGNTEGPTFGSLAAQGQGVQQQQQQQGLPFGSTTFGTSPSTPAFGSPGFGDQSAPRPSSAFSQWRQ